MNNKEYIRGNINGGNIGGGNSTHSPGTCSGCNRSGDTPRCSLDGTTENLRLARESARVRAGELNAISEYTYQSIVFADALPDLAAVFDEIVVDEMHHHRMLGELILRLGADPAERVAVRNSGGIDLSEDRPCRAPVAATRVLRSNIADERRAMCEYARLAASAERTGQLPAAAMFRRMAADEERHALRQESMLG